jgi:hypothetical protein
MIRDMPFYGISLDASLASKEKRKKSKDEEIVAIHGPYEMSLKVSGHQKQTSSRHLTLI